MSERRTKRRAKAIAGAITGPASSDPFDLRDRFDEIRSLEDGWLDGEGLAPDLKGIDWLECSIRDHFISLKQRPRIYPVPEGTISLEWSSDHYSASIEIDLGTKLGYWHVLDLARKTSEEETINLTETTGWGLLGHLLARIREGRFE